FIDENGVTNINQALIPVTAAEGEAAPAEPVNATDEAAEPFSITLGRMQINDASSDFTDRSLPIVFDTKMHALEGEVSGFSSASSQPMALGLEGQVYEFGLVEISGALDPLNVTRQTTITLDFTNLDLPSMTPYVIKFAGREIADGRVDVALAYTIDASA